MFKQKIKFFKKYKLNRLKNIKQNYKYIYIFRYLDLNTNENILLKKNIKKLNYNFLVLNQNLINTVFDKLKGQGPILIIYGNDDFNLIKKLSCLKKLDLIYLNINNSIYSNLKIKKITYNKNPIPLNNLIVQPFLNFIYYLRKI